MREEEGAGWSEFLCSLAKMFNELPASVRSVLDKGLWSMEQIFRFFCSHCLNPLNFFLLRPDVLAGITLATSKLLCEGRSPPEVRDWESRRLRVRLTEEQRA